MLFFQYLYALIIGPLELVFKIIFSVFNKYIPVTGVNILLLSLSFSLLVLPLYMRADKIQEEAREQEDKLGPTIKHIKKYFKGDERFMILQTFYRQNNYSPLSVLRSSVSLLLQVPFFLAAYRMLHNNTYLQGKGFGPITDLNSPDALLTFGGIAVNVLPFVMTAINLISAAIYANKMPAKSKIQLWIMAALFLVLLYNSPSGMVLYWTCNNLFSLVKNIINKLIASKKKAKAEKPVKAEKTLKNEPAYKAVFFFSCLTCAIYIGFYLPMITVASAPEEFVNLYSMTHPMLDILEATCKGLGLFLLWPSIFYAMSSKFGRKIMSYVMFSLAISSILNSKLFSSGSGDMSNTLIYKDTSLKITTQTILMSLGVTLGAVVVAFLLIRFGRNVTPVICFSAALVFAVLGLTNIGRINEGYAEDLRSETSKAEIPLSKDGKNVVVIMTDRAIGPMLPFIFNEKKDIKNAYDGFTYYHNTASFGTHTNFAVPSLLGGYEYTPAEMNKRSDRLLAEDHEQALKLMPTIFTNAGFKATVINPKYAGYQWYPDLSIFNDIQNLKAYSTKYSYLPDEMREGYKEEQTTAFRFNLFGYSIFRSAPVALHRTLYDEGNYNETRVIDPSRLMDQRRSGNSKSTGHEQVFMWDYHTLKAMSSMTKVEDGEVNNFVYIGFDTCHDSEFLQEPEYEPSDVVDNVKFDKSQKGQSRFLLKGDMMWIRDAKDYRNYQCNLATLRELGKWLDHLKEIGCYDNTRIIIVADHGYYIENFPNLLMYDIGAKLDGEAFAPLLMVKDFNSRGKLETSEEFMTNADTPYLATKDIISNPTNPFTGNPITDEGKKNGITVFHSESWKVHYNNGTAYKPGDWYTVKDSIWKTENWSYLGHY